MRFLFYFSHPAQYLSMRETIRRLLAKPDNHVTVLIKTKDVLEDLIKHDGIPYTNFLPRQRGTSRLAMALSLLKRVLLLLPIIWKKKPDLLIGTDAALAQVGKLLAISRITILEDDCAVIKSLANLTYPYTQTILCPDVCDVGRWQDKKVGYAGYMKLGYLHPAVFCPDNTVQARYGLHQSYVLVRLSKLGAHHDFDIRGIDPLLLDAIIYEVVERQGYQLWITSEGAMSEPYRRYQLQIHPADMHSVLANATLLISDSQSMSVEAAVLGIPSIRYSDLVGRISVLNELESRYRLTIGIPVSQREQLLPTVQEVLTTEELLAVYQARRQHMLRDKIDVTSFWVDFFENYAVGIKFKPTNRPLATGINT